MSAKVFLEILSGLRKAAPQVDLGDMARQVSVAPRVAAVEKMVQKAPGADWGWKGGKPGEVTGGEYVNALFGKQDPGVSRGIEKTLRTAVKQLEKYSSSKPNAPISMVYSSIAGKGYKGAKQDAARYLYLQTFRPIERANVPREWTGKMANALLSPEMTRATAYRLLGDQTPSLDARGLTEALADAASNIMRPMTNAQRETFLQLLPRWTGSIETAASAAKKLYKR